MQFSVCPQTSITHAQDRLQIWVFSCQIYDFAHRFVNNKFTIPYNSVFILRLSICEFCIGKRILWGDKNVWLSNNKVREGVFLRFGKWNVEEAVNYLIKGTE